MRRNHMVYIKGNPEIVYNNVYWLEQAKIHPSQILNIGSKKIALLIIHDI